ncbi:hypothetical protein C8T65DRAFT_587694 [Cerioporus squamosus]|nr:hypothetical protein C8T65DRAFT_587694 [Cerioporus squamosus]
MLVTAGGNAPFFARFGSGRRRPRTTHIHAPTSSGKSAAYDVYSKSLWGLGYGYPMWCPEPSLETGEIRVGDVGYLREGIFVCLFNALVPADDPVNASRGVPEGFESLTLPDRLNIMTLTSPIMQQVLRSKGVRPVDDPVAGDDSTRLRFRCTARTGALLLVGDPGIRQVIPPKRLVMKYMLRHHSSWMAFANDELGLGLREQDLLVIIDTTKTTSWVTVAFSKEDAKGYLNIECSGVASLSEGPLRVTVSMSHATNASVSARAGPANPPGAETEQSVANQCVFVGYYRRIKGIWGLGHTIRAAAGAHQLDFHPDDDPSSTGTFDLETGSSSDFDHTSLIASPQTRLRKTFLSKRIDGTETEKNGAFCEDT